jgi:hypothetical protein
MSRSRTAKRRARPPAPAATGRRFALLAGIGLAIALVVAGGYLWNQSRQADAQAAFQKLQGRWQRADGGYIIDIRAVAADGKLTAAYFNPQPINVAKADASREGGVLRVFIELRDVNYPGSTYQLTYDPVSDRLAGAYFQAKLRETYDVHFERLK